MKCDCNCKWFHRFGKDLNPECELYKKLIKDLSREIRNNCKQYIEKVRK